jgi:hypothetical protein
MNISEKHTHNFQNSVMLMARMFSMRYHITLSMNTSSFFPINVT